MKLTANDARELQNLLQLAAEEILDILVQYDVGNEEYLDKLAKKCKWWAQKMGLLDIA